MTSNDLVKAVRKNYIINLNTMLKENEETLRKRPVMLSFEKPSIIKQHIRYEY
jgi:hypothetical protein